MKLEIGKRYIRRDRSVTTITSCGEWYKSDDALSYAHDGTRAFTADSRRDIIAEYTGDPILESRIAELEARVAELEGPAPFKLEVGKRYVARDGRVTGLLEANSNSIYPFRCPNSQNTFMLDGKWREYVSKPEDRDLVSLYVEPETPVPPSGYLLYRDEPATISELRNHDSHEPIIHWSSANACWEAGLSRHGGRKFYAIRAGSALSYRCKLETLKLEAGKRYVLEDGRVTFPLCTDGNYPYAFVTGLDDDMHILHYWNTNGSLYNSYCTISSPISHPYES